MNVGGYSYIHENMRAEFRGGEVADDRARLSRSERGIALSGDAASISDTARALYEARKIEETASGGANNAGIGGEAGRERDKGPLGGLFDDFDAEALGAVGDAIASVGGAARGGSENITDARLKALQKQVEEAKKQLDKANQDLMRALSTAQADPAVGSAEEAGEVKDARRLVTEMNNNLLRLQEEMARAMREAYGLSPGGGGCIQGTRAEGGCGAGSGGHIGEPTDPYAAARAAEAAETGGA